MNRDSFHNRPFFLIALTNALLVLTLSLPARGQTKVAPANNPSEQATVSVAPVSAAAEQPNAATAQPKATATTTQATTSQEKEQKKEATPPVDYSWRALSLTILLFVVLTALFAFQFYWAQKLDRTAYLGTIFKDSIQDIEYKRLAAEYNESFFSGQYREEVMRDFEWLKNNPPPKRYFLGQNRRPGGTFAPGMGLDWNSPGAIDQPASPEERKAAEQKRQEYQQSIDEWEQKVEAEAARRYNAHLEAARVRAAELAGKAIDVDLSVLRGRGPEFVLGFTTIVAIVFAAVALGVLHVLDSQQIGTLFAAIAGYVLGRATARAAGAQEQPQSSAQESIPAKPKVLAKAG